MRLILISGDGHGAGKTFFARKLASESRQMFSIANLIRAELQHNYPMYDWYNKDPQIKINTVVKETGQTVHKMLDELGRAKRKKNPLVWAVQLAELLDYSKTKLGLSQAVVDDVRFLDEYHYLKTCAKHDHFTHFHISNPRARPEPFYENEELWKLADYIVLSQKTWGAHEEQGAPGTKV